MYTIEYKNIYLFIWFYTIFFNSGSIRNKLSSLYRKYESIYLNVFWAVEQEECSFANMWKYVYKLT